MTSYAKVICDSSYQGGHRLTTYEVRFHRFVLAEVNTHRVFSRNSASSRAIPLHKQIKKVRTDAALPVSWPREKKGMQGGEEIEPRDLVAAQYEWREAALAAADHAEELGARGVHKSVANRLLEPFMWHTAVITATAWDNFFGLRCNPMAQPEIRRVAEEMYMARAQSTPVVLDTGEWHLPYVTDAEKDSYAPGVLVQLSSARCARTSYETQDGVPDADKDIGLYDRLTEATPMHASPLEHVATPAPDNQHVVEVQARVFASGEQPPVKHLLLPRYGNLLGWHQHRFDVEAARQYQAFA